MKVTEEPGVESLRARFESAYCGTAGEPDGAPVLAAPAGAFCEGVPQGPRRASEMFA